MKRVRPEPAVRYPVCREGSLPWMSLYPGLRRGSQELWALPGLQTAGRGGLCGGKRCC